MTYDHWKTTNPADAELGSTMGSRMIPRSTRMQCAADDAAVIAETIEALDSLLERFHQEHGAALYADLIKASIYIDLSDAKALYAFAHSLEPVED